MATWPCRQPSSQPSSRKESDETLLSGPLVFAGSSEKDVSLAKQFWMSASLHPPNESQLVLSRDSKQRLPVARPSRCSATEKCYQPSPLEKPDTEAEKVLKIRESEEKLKYLQKDLDKEERRPQRNRRR
ncbi:cilia- and flagella-associated protein HOATZ [Echinops telfairi]|uniref:Cilia- and flagella-associated protein HOATZ n=1 Tax=Echinops telfairi TaxID=9371 RepID=A0AC55DPI6_ECHTE|nr:cilia- and flagella-associated protein HOATZ [Echinops telfairi]